MTTTSGKESITINGMSPLANTEDDDVVVEYEGIAKGDVVVVMNAQGSVYTLIKADKIEGKVSRISTNEYDETVLTVDGKQYVIGTFADDDTTLSNNSALINFNTTYEIYVYGDKIIGWKGAASEANVSDVVFVLGEYNVATVDTYGNDVTTYYAQGIDMEGKEVSILIGIDYAVNDAVGYTGTIEDLGVTSLAEGFYTFELSEDKDEKKANIMTGEPLADAYNEDEPSIYTGAVVDKDFDSKTTTVRTAATELAFLTENTKFIIAEGTLGDTLDVAVLTGSIRMDEVTAPVVLSQDENGNVTLEVMVIGVETLGVMAEDYIYVSESMIDTAANIGNGQLEYSVYFANDNKVEAIVVESAITDAGFYTYTYDAVEKVYDLTEADEDDTVVFVDEVFQSQRNGVLVSTHIEAFNAAEAKIFDARAEKVIAESDIAAIETLEDMADATLIDYVVTFSALVDEDENVTTIIVTSVEEVTEA